MANYNILAIPAMWLVTLAPQVYAVGYIKRANNGRFDNTNAHGRKFTDQLQKSVPADVLARFERAKAAHRNGLENLPLFAAAVLAAQLANVDAGPTAVAYLALRAVYNVCYISITSYKRSFIRTVVWLASSALCMSLFVRAAWK